VLVGSVVVVLAGGVASCSPTGEAATDHAVPAAAYAQRAGFPRVTNTSTTLGVTTTAVGDVMIVMGHVADTSVVSSVTDSQGLIAWQPTAGASLAPSSSNNTIQLWFGTVQAVGTTTIQLHRSNGNDFDHFIWATEFGSTLGASATWSLVDGGVDNSQLGNGNTFSFPRLSTGGDGGMYWGWSYPSTIGSAGQSPGFSYYVTPQAAHENVATWSGALAPNTAYEPVARQATAGVWYDAAAIIVRAAGTAPGSGNLGTAPGSGSLGSGPTQGVGVGYTTSAGYDMVGRDGGVFVFPLGRPNGYFGSLPGLGVTVDDVVGMVGTTDEKGYFLVGQDGGVFSFGDAPFLGSLPGSNIAVHDIVGIVPTADDRGYFLVGQDGGVFSFGDAPFLGSLPGDGIHRTGIVGIAATPGDNGYWLVGSDGAVYAFGAATYFGSVPLPSPPTPSSAVSAIVGTAQRPGYFVVTAGGAVYAFGAAQYLGSLPALGVAPARPMVGLVTTGGGYWLVGSDGGTFAFGDAPYLGSLPALGVHVTDVVGAVALS